MNLETNSAGTGQSSELQDLVVGLASMLLLLVGIAMGVATLYLVSYVGMIQSWKEVPATILEAGIDSHRDSEGTETSRVVVRYVYSVGPRYFISTRLGAFDVGDNFGDYQGEWHRRLESARERGQPVPCYLNPSNPAEALLDRRLRLELVVFGAFMSACFCYFPIAPLQSVLETARRRSPGPTSSSTASG